jgi:hypothetical protein
MKEIFRKLVQSKSTKELKDICKKPNDYQKEFIQIVIQELKERNIDISNLEINEKMSLSKKETSELKDGFWDFKIILIVGLIVCIYLIVNNAKDANEKHLERERNQKSSLFDSAIKEQKRKNDSLNLVLDGIFSDPKNNKKQIEALIKYYYSNLLTPQDSSILSELEYFSKIGDRKSFQKLVEVMDNNFDKRIINYLEFKLSQVEKKY